MKKYWCSHELLPPLVIILYPPQNSTDPIRVWSSCLVKCSEVLESCVSVFSEVKEQTVLEEIAQSEEGRNKLKGMVDSCLTNHFQFFYDDIFFLLVHIRHCGGVPSSQASVSII